MGTYEKTHPWLKFHVDLRQAPAQLWLLLGEARSKCDHLARVHLRPTTAENLQKLYLAKGVHGTTAIEGNSLTEDEVRRTIDGTSELPPSKQYLQQEVLNVVAACNSICQEIRDNRLPTLSPERICEFNRLVLRDLSLTPDIAPGQLRTYSVTVGASYRGAPAEDCGYLLQRLCDWLNDDEFKSNPGTEIVTAILRAVLAHLYLAWIHPFGDGNGRTARILELHILLEAGVPVPAAHLLSNHYNATRAVYYQRLDAASKSGGDVIPFLLYAAQGFVDGLREQLEYVGNQQWEIIWSDYVHDIFPEPTRPPARRQRDMLTVLGEKRGWIASASLQDLTPTLTRAYAGKTAKTMQRDVNALLQRALIERRGDRVRARSEILSAFLPLRTTESPGELPP